MVRIPSLRRDPSSHGRRFGGSKNFRRALRGTKGAGDGIAYPCGSDRGERLELGPAESGEGLLETGDGRAPPPAVRPYAPRNVAGGRAVVGWGGPPCAPRIEG